MPAPLDLDAAGVTVMAGSAVALPAPAPLLGITAIDPRAGLPANLTAYVQDDQLLVAAHSGAGDQVTDLTVTGRGCTSAGCNRSFVLRVPVTVRALTEPDGDLSAFTYPSPDRVAAGIPIATGGTTLRDKLVVTVGVPARPGTRAQAEQAAAAVGGVLTGGIERIGVYEIRWKAAQDLAQRRAELLAQPGVTSATEANVDVIGTDEEPPGDWSDDGLEATWPFDVTMARQAWDITHGTNVTVGIVDGGQVFAGHEDLDVVATIGSNPPDWHATHVAGTACARANGIGLVGFAWGCPVVTSGWNNNTDDGILMAASDVAEHPGVKVINISLGYGPKDPVCATQEVQDAYIALAAGYRYAFRMLFESSIGREVVWTVSAGNNCAPGVPSPWGLNADLDNVIAVAATNADGTLARFSDFGAGVELAAPGGTRVNADGSGGAGVWSTSVTPCIGSFLCATYAPATGTSMAAPAVAGVAALVRAAHPTYTAGRAARCITQTAGTVTGVAATRSTLPVGDEPHVDYSPTMLPILNAQAAVACDVESADRTDLISIAAGGGAGDNASFSPSVSGDGRYVAFASDASDLVAAADGGREIFVRDRVTERTELISLTPDGAPSDGVSSEPEISASGRYVAFESSASTLVDGDTNSASDIFVRDRIEDTTERVSVASDGSQGNANATSSSLPSVLSLSADGRYVAFTSRASNLVAGDTNADEDVFLHDRVTATTERVSVATGGAQGDDASMLPSISADGRFVAFTSLATNLAPGDNNEAADVFIHDRLTGVSERLSVASDGTQGNFLSFRPSVSGDGRYIAFNSYANNLVPGDTNFVLDTFVHDRANATTERVSVASDGTQGDRDSPDHHAPYGPSISADGRFVAFASMATNLAPGDTGWADDVFVRDRGSSSTERVSVTIDGAEACYFSGEPAISADGRFVAFSSGASNLVPGDTNDAYDVFLRAREGVPQPTVSTCLGF